jgi:ATPase subunit of ABC transporter with duplicated ATPase domains
VFSRLALEQPNVLVLDEPTNHLDLESIEALVAGLLKYDGTLILVSHDRWFVGQLATRVVEISRTGSATTRAPTRSTCTPAATTTWTRTRWCSSRGGGGRVRVGSSEPRVSRE